MKKIASHIAALLLAVSCVYPYSPEIREVDEQIPVIEGNIIIGGQTDVHLSRMVPLNSDSRSQALVGEAWIEDETGRRYPADQTAPASDFSIDTELAPPSLRYRLVCQIEGKHYASDWLSIPEAPDITEISFTADNDKVHVLADIEAGEAGSGYIGVSFEETWEFHADFYKNLVVDPEDWSYHPIMDDYPFYWCWRKLSTSRQVLIDYSDLTEAAVKQYEITSFSRSDSRNHKKYAIRVKAQHLTEESYRYLKNLQDHLEDGNSLFSPNPGEISGNLRCLEDEKSRVLGYVLCARQRSKRAFLDSRYSKETFYNTTALILPNERETPYDLFYIKGYQPINYMHLGDSYGVAWGPERCFNCLMAGGTQEKPDFWE